MRLPIGNVSVRAAAFALLLGASAVLVAASPASAATVTSFTPSCGPVGTVVTINGTGFSGSPAVDAVFFDALITSSGQAGGTPATTWAVVSDSVITADVPAGATTGKILVNTAGPDVSSQRSFTVTTGPCAAAHDRSITLVLRNNLTAKGRLTVADGFNDCRSDATVKIQRLTGGTWKTVGTDKTTGVGNYRVKLADKPGKYRASVKKQELNGGSDTCSAVTSKTVTHRR